MNSPEPGAVQKEQEQGREILEANGHHIRIVPQAHGGALVQGRGRPKGALARWSKAALREVERVYRGIGGTESMIEWARENPSDFYRGIYSKLLPSQYMVDARHQVQMEPSAMTDADLLRVIALATRPEVLAWADQQQAEAAALPPADSEPEPDPVQAGTAWSLEPEPSPATEPGSK